MLQSDEEFVEVVKNIILYHLVPDAAVFTGQVADGRVKLNTAFADVEGIKAVCGVLVRRSREMVPYSI